MIKPLAENFGKPLDTVEDVIKALLTMPKGYLLHPLGQQCVLGVDHVNGCVYMDDINCMGEYTYDLIEEAKRLGEPTEIEVPDSELAVYQPDLFAVIGYTDAAENGNYEAQLMGIFSTEELAKECGDELTKSNVIHHYEIESPKLEEFGYK